MRFEDYLVFEDMSCHAFFLLFFGNLGMGCDVMEMGNIRFRGLLFFFGFFFKGERNDYYYLLETGLVWLT